jgi:enamine deaminase RidA (YjgF/YER057c/UK114 family)
MVLFAGHDTTVVRIDIGTLLMRTTLLGETQIKGKVGRDVDVAEAAKAAEIATYNCLRAVGAVADIESIQRIVKVFGMVNVADGFDDTPKMINAASDFLLNVLGDKGHHARSAVGMVLPYGWAVEIGMVSRSAESTPALSTVPCGLRSYEVDRLPA